MGALEMHCENVSGDSDGCADALIGVRPRCPVVPPQMDRSCARTLAHKLMCRASKHSSPVVDTRELAPHGYHRPADVPIPFAALSVARDGV